MTPNHLRKLSHSCPNKAKKCEILKIRDAKFLIKRHCSFQFMPYMAWWAHKNCLWISIILIYKTSYLGQLLFFLFLDSLVLSLDGVHMESSCQTPSGHQSGVLKNSISPVEFLRTPSGVQVNSWNPPGVPLTKISGVLMDS